MPQNNAPGGFAIEDFLTRIVPGAVFLFPLLATIYITGGASMFPSFSSTIILYALFSYIIGEIIQIFRSGISRVPLPFSYYIYEVTEDPEVLPRWYRKKLNIEFWIHRVTPKWMSSNPDGSALYERLDFDFGKAMEERFQLDIETVSPRDLYDALLLYLGDEMSPRTRRQRSVYLFKRNLHTAISGSLLLHFASYALNQTQTSLFALLTAVLLFIVIFSTTRALAFSPHTYFELLIKEFYMMEVVDGNPD